MNKQIRTTPNFLQSYARTKREKEPVEFAKAFTMAKQVLMSSGTEEGLIECLKAYWPGQTPTLEGETWPKDVSNGERVVEGLQAVKKGKTRVRYQIVRVSI